MTSYEMKPNQKLPIAIIGAGGHAKEVYQTLLRYPTGTIEFLGFFVTIEVLSNESLYGWKVQPMANIPVHANVHIAIGSIAGRRMINDLTHDKKKITIVDCAAIIGSDVELGDGCYIAPNATITANVRIGINCIVNTAATICHDVQMGGYCNISPAATICGGAQLGEGVYIGAASIIREKIKITDNTIIGMGANVLHPIEKEGTYVGNPAAIIPS